MSVVKPVRVGCPVDIVSGGVVLRLGFFADSNVDDRAVSVASTDLVRASELLVLEEFAAPSSREVCPPVIRQRSASCPSVMEVAVVLVDCLRDLEIALNDVSFHGEP